MTANVAIISNRNAQNVDLYFSGNGYTLATGNSSTSNVNGTNTCLALSGETIRSCSIGLVQFSVSSSNTYWQISRGANTYFTLYGGGSVGTIDFAGSGQGFELDSTANVNVTLNGGGTGFLTLRLRKQTTVN